MALAYQNDLLEKLSLEKICTNAIKNKYGTTMKRTSNKNHIYLIIVIVLSIVGSIFIAWCTREGPWGWSDSVAYLASARNMIKGIGIGYYFPNGSFYTQIIQAPFYPVILALIGILRVDLIAGARVLNILLFGGTIFFAGLIFIHYSNYPWLSVIACIVLGTFPGFVEIYTGVMTEPLFLFLYFLGVYFLFGYLKQKRNSWLITSGIITGLLPATRYIGFVCILTSIFTIMLFLETDWRIRFKSALLFGLLSIIPIAIWGMYLLVFMKNISQIENSGINWDQMIGRFADFRAMTIQIVWKWVPLHEYIVGIKSRYQYLIILAIIFSIALLTYSAKQMSTKRLKYSIIRQEYILYCVFGCSGLGLFVFMVFTYIFFQLPGRMDDRQLLPVFVSCALSIICAAALWINPWLKTTKSWEMIAGWGMVLFLLFWCYPQYIRSTNFTNLDQGLLSSSWRDSETVHAIRQISPDTPIVSNNAAAILYWADRPAWEIIENLTTEFVSETTPYGSDKTDRAQIAFQDDRGILVIFNNFPTQMSNLFYEQGILRLNTIFSGLVVQNKYHDGTIFTLGPEIIP